MGEFDDLITIGSGAGRIRRRPAFRTRFAGTAGVRRFVTAGGALINTIDVKNCPRFQSGIQDPDLTANMRSQAEGFGDELIPDHLVAADLYGDTKTITSATGAEHRATAVIGAAGSQHGELGLPNEDPLAGPAGSWCAICYGFVFKTRPSTGGGDTAVEEASLLARFDWSVTVVHRRGCLRASMVVEERTFADPRITFARDSTAVVVRGDQKLSRPYSAQPQDGTDVQTPCHGPVHRHRPRFPYGALRRAVRPRRRALPQSRDVVDAHQCEGSLGAGDVVDHTYRQAVTAAGSGCMAVLDAERFLAAIFDVPFAEPEKAPTM
ncbi:thioredoxin reductase [Streptomyces fructofermentans]|uniref:Thioredoxin reductase n=1 Tax=Streptomyces fructofermentans TaxID=152141 RepID=A0A918KQK0_9ACTN|nr:thioredoxin reductase [Streptomyces fructofermentans]